MEYPSSITYLGSQIHCVEQISYLPHNRTTHKVIPQRPEDNLRNILGTMLDPRDMDKTKAWSWISGNLQFNRATIIRTTNNVMTINKSWSSVLWDPRRENAHFVDASSMR